MSKIIMALLLGLILGSLGTYGAMRPKFKVKASERHLGQTEFINPLLQCSDSPDGDSPKIAQLEEIVSGILARAKRQARAREISVYFRDLNNGPDFEINARVDFVAASLLKVPVLIAYLKEAENNPAMLDETFEFNPEKHVLKQIVQQVQRPGAPAPGEKITVRELLRRMIVESDNIAATMLIEERPHLEVIRILDDMGVQLVSEGPNTGVNVKSYASLFRIMYNATYLSHASSNQALKLLSLTRFRDGLPAGVAPDVAVAHKFGERIIDENYQFHDCGVVYYPKRPYLLCVMSRGKDFKPLVELVAEISKTVFDYVKTGL
ncbi:MAG TPA: class A beta-lactamase-related serine hydrolase [Bdellovibrionales bacterium]|nr:class A beta-lactamase-related serine hydrolase [Bdellovibrionales bacterium]